LENGNSIENKNLPLAPISDRSARRRSGDKDEIKQKKKTKEELKMLRKTASHKDNREIKHKDKKEKKENNNYDKEKFSELVQLVSSLTKENDTLKETVALLEASLDERINLLTQLDVLENKFEIVSKTKVELSVKVEELEAQLKKNDPDYVENKEVPNNITEISFPKEKLKIDSESDVKPEFLIAALQKQIKSLEAEISILKNDNQIHRAQISEKESDYINLTVKDVVAGSTKAGYLMLQGHKEKKWKKRYFVLRNNYLLY